MRIAQRRIRTLHAHLLGVPRDAVLTPALLDLGRHAGRLREAGFPARPAPGQALLPAVVGPRSRFNADGGERVHRELPMESVTHLAWARWLERHGAEQREFRGVRPWSYRRFPRSGVPAPGVELRVMRMHGGALAVVAETLRRGRDDARMLHTVNLMLELFGECDMLTEVPEPPVSLTSLNWELAPPPAADGVPPGLEAVVDDLPPKERQVAEYRLARVGELEPDFLAVGRAGFRGCAVFGFAERGRMVLESLYGDETLVGDRPWDEIARLGKAELLEGGALGERIEHRPGWETRLRHAVREGAASR